MVVRGRSVLTRAEKSLLENAPVADTFVDARCGRIVNTSLRCDTGGNKIREARESAEARVKCYTRGEPANQRANIRVPVDALEESAAVIADIANLRDIVPINLALNAKRPLLRHGRMEVPVYRRLGE